MKKKYNIRLIKDKRSYTFTELAECLKVHIRTVQTWHKLGMPVIEGSQNPYLVIGKDAKQFIKTFQEKNTVKLKDNEFYCVVCKKAVIPQEVKKCPNNLKMGKNKKSITLKSHCPLCQRTINRFSCEVIEKQKPSIKKENKPAKIVPQKIDNSLFADLPLFRKGEINII